MDRKNESKSIVEHHYHIPKADAPTTENFRSISIVRLNESVTVTSSFPNEDILLIANLVLDLLSKIKEEK